MKKFFVIFYILILNFTFGKDLNKYESKRVLEKTLDYTINGSYEKYKNDEDIKNILEDLSAEKFEQNTELYIRPFFKQNKYVILDVNENNGWSILTVKAEYPYYKEVSKSEYERVYKEFLEESENKGYQNKQEFNIAAISYILEKIKDKKEVKEKIIKVHMNKEDGYWNIISDKSADRNKDFFETIMWLDNILKAADISLS